MERLGIERLQASCVRPSGSVWSIFPSPDAPVITQTSHVSVVKILPAVTVYLQLHLQRGHTEVVAESTEYT